jgi:hypothetical protein
MKMRRSFLWIAAAPALLLGCMPDIPQDPPPTTDRVVAVFDTETSTIPLPNTAALEEDGTLPQLPGAGEDNANGAFLSWLDGLHGWSESTPIEVPFSGKLDPETVNADNVYLWKRGEDGFTLLDAQAEYVENTEENTVCNPAVCESVVRILPTEPLEFGATYAAAVSKEIKDTNDNRVSESTAVFFAASPDPLFENGEILVSVLEPGDGATDEEVEAAVEQAATLEGLRQLLAPVFTAAADAGLSRDDVASAFTWSVTNDPFTVLDPATGTLPIPNDVALDPDRTFPAAALNFCGGPNVDPQSLIDPACDAPPPDWVTCTESADCTDADSRAQCIGGRCVRTDCAQGEFDRYLDGLHGWPTTTPITLPVTAPIDESTLSPETVQLWMQDAEGAWLQVPDITVSLTECGDEILITPPAEMGYAAKYFAFATRDVLSTNTGPDGNQLPLIPSAPLLLAMMPDEPGTLGADCDPANSGQACDGGGVCSVIPGEGAKCVTSNVDNASDADAAGVMAVRPIFRPAVEAIEANTDLAWDDLAASWAWTTWTDTFLVFDPTAGNIPFPHTLLTSGCPDEEPICNLPEGEGATAALLDELRTREGFSSTAPHWIPTLGPPLDPETVNTDTVLFAEAAEIPPPLYPKDQYNVEALYDHIIVSFNQPLTPEILVAGLATTDVKGSNGFAAQPTPAFVFLRSEFPLVDENGNKTVQEIPDDETAQLLEASRNDFEQLFLVALLFGYGRDQVNNAWAFDTGQTYRPLQQLRALTVDELATGGIPQATAMTPDVVVPDDNTPAGTVPDPDNMDVDVDVSNVAEIHWALEYDTTWWLDGMNRLMDTPATSPVGASVFIPKQDAECSEPFDVAIVQHGYTNYRKNMGLALANEMAAECIAVVAIDLPLHGGRIPGAPDLHPATKPAGSGDGYISEDFVGSVALLQQSAIDEVVLTKMIKGGAFDAALAANSSVVTTFSDDTSNVGYIGNSMGAFVGTLFTTIEPEVGPTVLNVAGGKFSLILQESAAFAPILDGFGIPEDTFEELQALHFVQWLGEHADPYAFAPYPVLDPLTEIVWDSGEGEFADGETLPAKDVIIQMVENDQIVPNSSTELLAGTMGVELTDTTFPSMIQHGFLGVLDPTSASFDAGVCARQQAAAWMSTSFAGAAEIPAGLDATSCLNQ